MSIDHSKILSLNSDLQSDERRLEALKLLNTLLESCTNTDALQICSIINPQQIFLLLDTTSLEEIELLCSIISKMLIVFPASELSKMSQYIELGLQHESECVRKMTLHFLSSRIDSDELVDMLAHPTMFHLVTQLIGDDFLECAKYSSNILLMLAKHRQGRSIFELRQMSLDIDLKGLLLISSSVRYRVFDLIVSISCLDKTFFNTLKGQGYFSMLVSDLECNDVLLKLNCLEVLEVLMSTQHGGYYIQTEDVLIKLHNILHQVDVDPLSTMLIPGILKFYGHYCKYCGLSNALTISRKCPLFLQTITMSLIESPQDEALMGVAMDTLGLLGSNLELRPLLQLIQTEHLNKTIKKLWEYALYSQSHLQVRAFNVMSTIFSCEVDNELINSDWFNLCPSETPLSVVMAIVKRPFSDLQLSGLNLILSISQWEWGLKQINKCPGLIEYVLDRKAVSDINGKKLKFQIVSMLANSSMSESVFGNPSFLKFKEYERDGPFYVTKDNLSVAFEES